MLAMWAGQRSGPLPHTAGWNWSSTSELEQVLVQTESFVVVCDEDYLVDSVVISF